MNKIGSILLLIFLMVPYVYSDIDNIQTFETKVLNFGQNTCKDIKQTDIPTIFIPGILASWYSEEGLDNNKIKRWVPDPVTHVYDTLFYTFYKNNYIIADVFYRDEFTTYIDDIIEKEEGKRGLFYLFGYDWKKDNKITAKLLSDLIKDIRVKYEDTYGCDIGTVNIVAHSMGGLVARAMLEDMCASKNSIKDYNKKQALGRLKYIKSSSCNNFTKINKFITVGTPHRGSPGSFPLWEKGDIDKTTAFGQSLGLSTQLGELFDNSIYDAIHGYTDKIPNGIITIGQLLPDIGKSGIYNNSLKYLFQNGKILDKNTHPKNSFLEELNTSKNIDKMFSNISGKYILYYSNLTSTLKYSSIGENISNIVGFNISDEYWTGLYGFDLPDKTENYKGKNIYDTYGRFINTTVYNIGDNITNDSGLGGDGTVPSLNSKLVPNDLYNPGIFTNDKFQYKEILCFYNEGDIPLINREREVSYKLGSAVGELCSHTKLTITASLDIFSDITGEDYSNMKIVKFTLGKIKELYSNIGYIDSIIGTYDKFNDIINAYSKIFDNKNLISDFIENKILFNDRKEIYLGNPILGIYRYEILSPINIIIEDHQGRKIGIDPDTNMIINEIPGAWTSGDTEGSTEPEFFFIPYIGNGNSNHKITSFPTGNGEYNIVIKDYNISNFGKLLEIKKNIIPGIAKKGIIENYDIIFNKSNILYTKSNIDFDNKYNNILQHIITILNDEYTITQRINLKNNLEKIIVMGNVENKYTDKVFYLIEKVFNYLNVDYE